MAVLYSNLVSFFSVRINVSIVRVCEYILLVTLLMILRSVVSLKLKSIVHSQKYW